MIIFITGGVRSGKSAFAENYAVQLFQQHKKEGLYYIASGVAFDYEMEARIKKHRQDRSSSIVSWKTVEVMDDIPRTLHFAQKDVVLWDCITTWLSNVLYKTEQEEDRLQKIEQYILMLKQRMLSWEKAGALILIVSNEVLDETDSPFEDTNLYKQLLGQLHQWFVSVSNEAYEMDYSIARRWK